MKTVEMITFLIIFICTILFSSWRINKIENKDNL